MDSNRARAVKSTQEQATAAWIGHINQIRVDNMIERLGQQDLNLEGALKELSELKEFVGNPDLILGSPLTKHGEIAEHVQVNFSNARNLVQGLERNHTFEGVGRTAPEDYLRNGQMVQSKFYNGSKNTIEAVSEHLKKYPDFVKNGGSYDIPKEQYDEIVRVLKLSDSNPSALSKADWKLVEAAKKFQSETGLDFNKDVNAAVTDYKSVQQGKIDETIKQEEKNIKKQDEEQRKGIIDDGKPTLKEGAKAAAIGAALEGGMAFCMTIASKRKEGKAFSEFTEEDWKDIGLETGKGVVKGGIRGGAVYAITNFTATPSNVASAYVTAAFGVAAQANAYRKGEISKEDFVINCETVALDVTVSAIASAIGQAVIPIPVLGALVGNVAGEFVYGLCKQYAGEKEAAVISSYRNQMALLNQQLDAQFRQLLMELERVMKRFSSLEAMAFDVEFNRAFEGSVLLAREVGVEEKKILKTKEEIDAFFLA